MIEIVMIGNTKPPIIPQFMDIAKVNILPNNEHNKRLCESCSLRPKLMIAEVTMLPSPNVNGTMYIITPIIRPPIQGVNISPDKNFVASNFALILTKNCFAIPKANNTMSETVADTKPITNATPQSLSLKFQWAENYSLIIIMIMIMIMTILNKVFIHINDFR